MANDPELDRLAQLHGIWPDYVDVWDERHAVPDRTKRALLAAMGQPAEDEGAVAERLREADEAGWRRLLPPVGVYDEGAAIELIVTLPAGKGGSLRWRVTAESGEAQAGEAAIPDLEPVESLPLDHSRRERRRLRLPVSLPAGYHRLRVEACGRDAEMRLIVAPQRCFGIEEAVGDGRPDGRPNGRLWGVAVQIYGLRSETDWGAGDLGDLAEAAERAAALGADVIGINPVHALFPADPLHFGPYAPSNRRFLNILYIDVDALPELAHCPEARARIAAPEFREALRAARAAELVDYAALSRLKLPVLEALFGAFRAEGHPGGALAGRRTAFDGFRAEMGAPLERHALFEALHEHFFAGGAGPWSWRDWPEPYRRCGSPETAAFAAERRDRVAFFAWLQWLADDQLRAAQQRARAAGMALGIYRDIAVGVHADGSAAWMQPGIVLSGVSVGAPPDPLGPEGQNWGVSPLSPDALYETAYEPFIAELRANMRHAGALRIDHVMALQRLFWIPRGLSGAEGAYVSFPFEDLLRIVALESRRNRCVVIGEDLGTVPEGFRPTLERAGLLSYRILQFERAEGGAFKPPEDYPPQALAAPSTHDLPTLAGFWAGRDLDWREATARSLSDRDRAAARERRRQDRARLLDALRRSGEDIAAAPEAAPEADPPPGLREAVYRFLARAPAQLLMVSIEDLAGEVEQPNLPGTTDEHPNWRRRLPRDTAAILTDPAVRALARMINEIRGRPGR